MSSNTRVKLTIALQTFNRGDDGYLQLMLDSILSQSYTDFELLVMDNHSSDSTTEIITHCDDPRLTYVRQPPGGSATTNTNRAVWMSRGEYVLATHDDDILEPDMVLNQLTFLAEHPDAICVTSNVSLMNPTGEIVQPKLYDITSDLIFEKGEYISTYLKEKLWLPTPTMMYRRDAYMATQPNNVRMPNPPYFPSGDIWSVFMFNLRGQVALLAQPNLRYRQHPGQESRLVNQSEPMLELMSRLLRSKSKHPLIAPLRPVITALKAKYKLQDLFFKWGQTEQSQTLTLKVNQLYTQSLQQVSVNQRSIPEFLPVEIAQKLLTGRQSTSIEPIGLKGIHASYSSWLEILDQDSNLLESKRLGKSIAVIGSMLTAHLIVLDAFEAGIRIEGIYDSSPARQGKNIFGNTIRALQDLKTSCNEIDMIILSSERDHEAAIVKLIQPFLNNEDIPIISWKQLALTAKEMSND